MKYFAYGSNMAIDRLRERAPSAQCVGVFLLKSHDLRFHKVGGDRSAKCNAFYTGSDADVVEGVIFDLDPGEIESLDKIEGLGHGYKKKSVHLVDFNGVEAKAFTYLATNINESLRPFSWYRDHVLIGARNAGLRSAYVEKIERVQTVQDPDAAREKRELAIHD